MTNCSIILTTTDQPEIARAIASDLVKSNLASCVQIDKVTSIYEWQGNIAEAEEYRLSIKAADKNIKAIEKRILELHNYELPEIIAIPITGGSDKYIMWLKTS